jgi:DNA-binding Lrp family transcriptional regulator
MNATDERTLEYLAEEGPDSPTVIADDPCIHVNRVTVNRRLKKLTDAGFTRMIRNGVYQITDDGRAYLKGEDFTDVEEPE